MTGIFEVYLNDKMVKTTELPEEVIEILINFYNHASRNEELKIRCELEQ